MYGASYKGSGTVTHKLSLYRHICNINNTIIHDEKVNANNFAFINENKNESIKNLENFESLKNSKNSKLKNKKINNFRKLKTENDNKTVNTDLDFYDDIMNHNSKLLTSLVFGAGTVQWSYALSDFHGILICYIFPSHEYIFLIDFILYLCRSGWSVLVWI
jgi:hypothetical protein